MKIQSGGQCVTARAGPRPSHPRCVEKPSTPPFTPFSVSFLSQQQANLIPGLNLSALGIFSSGLSMLPSTPGARGAAAATPYHPFAVSVSWSWCPECPARALGFGYCGMDWGVPCGSGLGGQQSPWCAGDKQALSCAPTAIGLDPCPWTRGCARGEPHLHPSSQGRVLLVLGVLKPGQECSQPPR